MFYSVGRRAAERSEKSAPSNGDHRSGDGKAVN